MDVLVCPICRSKVRVEVAEVHEPYLCKKCHTPFHLNKSRVAVVGDPPDVALEVEALKRKALSYLERIPVRPIAIGLAALVVVYVAASLVLRPARGLSGDAEKVARALASGDRAALESIAAPGTAGDVAEWFDEVHPQFLRERERWFGQKEVVGAHVILEDRDEGKGIAGIVIQPVTPGARDVTLADPSAATAAASSPFTVETAWTLNRWGRWRLDGHAMVEQVQPTHQAAIQ